MNSARLGYYAVKVAAIILGLMFCAGIAFWLLNQADDAAVAGGIAVAMGIIFAAIVWVGNLLKWVVEKDDKKEKEKEDGLRK